MRHPLAPGGRVFAVAAFIEAITWAGLLLGMLPKHGTHATDLGTWLSGHLPGGAFSSSKGNSAGRAAHALAVAAASRRVVLHVLVGADLDLHDRPCACRGATAAAAPAGRIDQNHAPLRAHAAPRARS